MSITKHELKGKARFEDDYHTFHLKSLPEGVAAPNGAYYLGKQGIDGHRYRLGHPLAQHVLNRAAIRGLNGAALTFDYSKWPQKSVALEPFVGASGLLLAHKLSVRGADDQDHIILAAVTDKGDALDAKTAARLFELPVAGIKEHRLSGRPAFCWRTNSPFAERTIRTTSSLPLSRIKAMRWMQKRRRGFLNCLSPA